MAEDRSILAQDFERLLAQVSPETQKKLIEAKHFSEFQNILGSTHAEAERYFNAREAYFSGSSNPQEKTEPLAEKDSKEKEHRSHQEHPSHTHSSNESESITNEGLTPEQNVLSNEPIPNDLGGQAIPNQLSQRASQPSAPDPNTLSGTGRPNTLSGTGRPNNFPLRRKGGSKVTSAGKTLAKKGGKKIAVSVFTNPYVLAAIGVAIGIVIGFLILIAVILHACKVHEDLVSSLVSLVNPAESVLLFPFMLLGREIGLCESPYNYDVPQNPPGVTTKKTGLTIVKNGEALKYTLTVSYDPGAPDAISFEEFSSMSLFDVPVFNYQFVRSTGTPSARTDPEGDDYVQYEFDRNPTCLENYTCEFELTITPSGTDFIAINTIYVATEYEPVNVTVNTDVEGAPTEVSGDLTIGRNSLPSNKTCGGQWGVGPNNKNFGDPECSYTPERFSAYLREIARPDDVEFFEDISIAEGSSPKIGGNLNSNSASGWGTFQMGPASETPHNHGPGNWGFRQFWDHGDVPWQRQIEFAVQRNNYWRQNFNGNFTYWGTAYCLCYFDSYRNSNKGWCDDIIQQRAVRCPQKCHPITSGASSCSIYTDRLAEKRGNSFQCNKYRCNIGTTGLDDNLDKPWN